MSDDENKKEIERLLRYFKALDDLTNDQFFNQFHPMYEIDSTEELKEKLDNLKLQINDSKASLDRLRKWPEKSGHETLDSMIAQAHDVLGVEQGIELSDVIVNVNLRTMQLIQTILATRELIENADSKRENGRSKDGDAD